MMINVPLDLAPLYLINVTTNFVQCMQVKSYKTTLLVKSLKKSFYVFWPSLYEVCNNCIELILLLSFEYVPQFDKRTNVPTYFHILTIFFYDLYYQNVHALDLS